MSSGPKFGNVIWTGVILALFALIFILRWRNEARFRRKVKTLKESFKGSTEWVVLIGTQACLARSLAEVMQWFEEKRISLVDPLYDPRSAAWTTEGELPEFRRLTAAPDQARAATRSSTGNDAPGVGCGCVLVSLAALGLFVWLAIAFFGDNFKADKQDDLLTQKAQVALLSACSLAFPNAESRIEPRFGGNVRVYIGKHDFENVPYPDRENVVTQLGKAWCDNVDHTLLASVSINDIRTGDRLASYSCVIGHTSLK